MKPEDIEKRLKHMAVKSPAESLDIRIETTLGGDDISADGLSVYSRVFARRRVVALLSAAIAVIVAITIVRVFFRSSDQHAIAFADVARSFREAIETCERIHLVKTNRRVFSQLDIDDVIEREEVWVQRPAYMREETIYTFSDAVTEDERSTYYADSRTRIYNEAGNLDLNHVTRRWGIHDGDTRNVHTTEPYRDVIQGIIDRYLRARFYTRWDERDSGHGTLVEHTEVDGEAVTVYDFVRNESTEYEETCRCWLRDSDNRLVRMELFLRKNKQDPVWIYYPIEYNPEIPEGTFDHEIPEGYVNGQLLGYEDRPYEINPNLVAVVHEAESAKIYKLDLQPGQSREEVLADAVAKGTPRLHVHSPLDEIDSTMDIGGAELGIRSDGSPRVWSAGGSTPAGSHYYGVRKPGREATTIVSERDFNGTDQVVFEYVIYRTNRMFCKMAYDADGDGVMDAWCEVPTREPRD